MKTKIRFLKKLLMARHCAHIALLISGATMLASTYHSLLFTAVFQLFCYSIVALILLRTVIDQVKGLVHAMQQLEATNMHCDAEETFHRWYMDNLDKGLAHPTAQRLLKRQIKMRKRFEKIHRFKFEPTHLKCLREMLQNKRVQPQGDS